MLRAIPVPCPSCSWPPAVPEVSNYASSGNLGSKRLHPTPSVITCASSSSPSSSSSSSSPPVSSRGHAYIPRLEPFSRTKLERALKDPPLIEKSENELAEYCSVLDGEESYNCWRAYFELKELEKEAAKEEVERLILQAGGVKSLIGCLHGIAEIHKAKKEAAAKKLVDAHAAEHRQNDRMLQFLHIPDGLPRSREEMEEEEEARMPDSPFTRLLRVRGKHPAWYSPAPDHESD